MSDTSPPSNWTGLPAHLPAELVETANTTQMAKGQSLFHTGDSVESFHFVRAGELAAVRCMPNGAEAIMLTARAGEFFGEASLFQPAYTCEARALSASVLVSFSSERFRKAMAGDPAFALAFTRTVAMSLRKQCSRVERLRLKSASDRVLHYLACETGPSGWAELGGTLQEWAAELALEPETLYRTLAQLEKEGTLAREQRRLRLLGHSVMACASLSPKT
ncbi:MAG: Crp/Fnr family transcriptional regulator [Thiobacillus sp.]|nr:Crp/Fnr family transcriptional regulator [Thiobacillus sp.]